MINIGIIEDDTLIREGYAEFLNQEPGFECIHHSGSVEGFLEALPAKLQLQVILIDIGLPGMSGIEGIRLIRKRLPETAIIMITVYNDEDKILRSIRAGAEGYLLKNTPLAQISQGIHEILKGGSPISPSIARQMVKYHQKNLISTPLTDRELEVVQRFVEGDSYKLAADYLKISMGTLQSHVKNIYRKLEVNSKAEVISKSLRGEI